MDEVDTVDAHSVDVAEAAGAVLSPAATLPKERPTFSHLMPPPPRAAPKFESMTRVEASFTHVAG